MKLSGVKLEAGQLHVLDEVIRAFEYYHVYERHKLHDEAMFVKGCMIKMGIMMWCQIFGSDSEKTHWSKNVGESTRLKIVKECGVNDWSGYRDRMLNVRNKLISHFDVDIDRHSIPSIKEAIDLSVRLRLLILERMGGNKESEGSGSNSALIINNLFRNQVNKETGRIDRLYENYRGLE